MLLNSFIENQAQIMFQPHLKALVFGKVASQAESLVFYDTVPVRGGGWGVGWGGKVPFRPRHFPFMFCFVFPSPSPHPF